MSSSELFFEGKKIYYSGSIRGVPNSDPEFPWSLVQYMIQNGANVLSEHVAARDHVEMARIFTRRSGIDILRSPDRAVVARQVDMHWVSAATHLVALVDSPSFGVGMEIERAILKPRLGLNLTPILCLVHEQTLRNNKLSNMLTGITLEECPVLRISPYVDLQGAKDAIKDFLLNKWE